MPESTPSNDPPVLVLLHGATLNGRMWDAVRRHLDARYRVLTPDLPGHGSRRGEPYTLEAAVQTVLDAARTVAPARVVVCGDSLGGYTTLASAAALQQTQLQALVVSGASVNFEGPMVWTFLLRGALFNALATVFGEDRLVRRLMPKELTRNIGLSEGDAQALIDAGIRVRAYAEGVRALRGVDFRAKLAAVTQPVLLLNGDADPPNVRGEAAFLAAAQRVQAHRFADCEHGVSMRRPEEFARVVNAFLAQL